MLAEYDTKGRRTDGKIPRMSVPSAAAQTATLVPGESGARFAVDSPGSFIYMATTIFR
jgi:hypothetical protein